MRGTSTALAVNLFAIPYECLFCLSKLCCCCWCWYLLTCFRPWGIDVELYDYEGDFDMSLEDYMDETARMNASRTKRSLTLGASSTLLSTVSQDAASRPASPGNNGLSVSLSKSFSTSTSRPSSPSQINRSGTAESSMSITAPL